MRCVANLVFLFLIFILLSFNSIANEECFLSDTKVQLSNGSIALIQDIQIGDTVKGQTQDNDVIDLYHFTLGNQPVYSINNGRFFVTGAHPFFTTDGWKAFNVSHAKYWNPDLPISKLGIGDTIITESSSVYVHTVRNKPYPADTEIFNFVLDGDKTYYADNYLVHNKECFLVGTMIEMADGSIKPIEKIKVGDLVLGNSRINKVKKLYHYILGAQPVYSINSGRYFVTSPHPFMTTKGWAAIDPVAAKHWNPDLSIKKLEPGDVLITKTGSLVVREISAKQMPYITQKFINFVLRR